MGPGVPGPSIPMTEGFGELVSVSVVSQISAWASSSHPDAVALGPDR